MRLVRAQPDVEQTEAQWRYLDPLFILGKQRSGTSIIEQALIPSRFISFGEDHLWFQLIESLARLHSPERVLNRPLALGAGRHVAFEKYIAVAIDQFHRDHLSPQLARWLSKSPGSYEVKMAPMLAVMFPQSQFIFAYRNGIATVNSGMKWWPDKPWIFGSMCRDWTLTMQNWRRVRSLLEGRYIEVAQERVVEEPGKVATELATFLRVPEHRDTIAKVFQTRRFNTAFPNKAVGDYRYEIDWSEKQRTFFIETCGREMEIWGYPMDFDDPTGSRLRSAPTTGIEFTDMQVYYKWLNQDQFRRSERQDLHLSPQGSTQLPPTSIWSDRCWTAWSVLQSEGPLALLDRTKRFLYWRLIHRWKGA